MKTKFLCWITLVGTLASASAWALPEMELVIEPVAADSDGLIRISVTNSACYYHAEADLNSAINSFSIRLSYSLGGTYEQCLAENPDAPDFETTLGPLAPGLYGVTVTTHTGGFIFPIADSESVTVIEAAPAAHLSDGGINGLYYNPEADGRYVYVLETDYNTMVMWTTFDAEGNQLWVYGVGETLNNGSTVVADAYINQTTGGVLPDGAVEVTDEPWGVIRVDMTSCLEGTITYWKFLPQYPNGSGAFPITRLAYSKQIGCVDSE